MKNTNYKLIILAIASRSEIYDKFINIWYKKFIKLAEQYSIKIFLIFGKDIKTDDLLIEQKDILILDVNETYIPGILQKTLLAFQYINDNYEYKHIFRTNLSSFFILDNLLKMHEKLDDKDVYAGVVYHVNSIYYCSGAGMWFSTDNITYILDNLDKIPYDLIDDIAIGKVMEGKKQTNLIIYEKSGNHFEDRYDFTNNIDVEDKTPILNRLLNNGYYHMRFKNEKDRNLDIVYLNFFINALYN
jgi:hypothetical protein